MEKNLSYEKKNCWKNYSKKDVENIFKYAVDYKEFLKKSKTERLSVDYVRNMAHKDGFKENGKDKFIIENKNKNIALIVLGKKSPLDGVKFIASHVDVPRIDVKQNPLYEKEGIAHLKTHYYGGIKKYHWLSRPLAIYGVILRRDGKTVNVAIGDGPDDPVFVINDLLPHLSKEQSGKFVKDAFDGEKLNIIIGSIPLKDEEKDGVKKNILKILNEMYGIEEEDFVSAELEIVPQGGVFDIGLDRGLIGGYGHDDRVCGYTSATALFDSKNTYTACAILFDKEEIGSDGATGAKSQFIDDIAIEILKRSKIEPTFENVRKLLKNSDLLSSDVSCGIDPDFQDVHEPLNSAKIGYGLVITKFTGSGGKFTANDANAEFVFKVRNIFNKAGVVWQTAELGKVDAGGGGTIAMYLAMHGINVIDCGPALLGMHSPMELVSKADLYETYKGYKAFFES